MLQLLPQNALYIIIRTRNILQIGKSLASVWIPAGSRALHWSSAGHAGTEGSTEVQLGSPSSGNTVGPGQQCLGRVGDIPSAQAPSARDRAHLNLSMTLEWLGNDSGIPLPTLPEPWSPHEAALEGTLPAASKGSAPPASLRRVTFTANTPQKVGNAPRARFPTVLGGVSVCSEALLRSDSAQEGRQGLQRGGKVGRRAQKHPLSFWES